MKKLLMTATAAILFTPVLFTPMAVQAGQNSPFVNAALQGLQTATGITPQAAPALPTAQTTATQIEATAVARARQQVETATARMHTRAQMPSSATAALTSAATALPIVDTDHNGEISLAEMDTLDHRMFAMADVNHDGQLSKTELQAMGTAMAHVVTLIK